MGNFMIELTNEEEIVISGGARYGWINIEGVMTLVLLDD